MLKPNLQFGNTTHNSFEKAARKDLIQSANFLPSGWVEKHKWLDRAEIEFHPSMFGLPPGKPLIANPRTSELLIDCEGQYVLWNNVSDEAARIDQPKEY